MFVGSLHTKRNQNHPSISVVHPYRLIHTKTRPTRQQQQQNRKTGKGEIKCNRKFICFQKHAHYQLQTSTSSHIPNMLSYQESNSLTASFFTTLIPQKALELTVSTHRGTIQYNNNKYRSYINDCTNLLRLMILLTLLFLSLSPSLTPL